MNSRTVDLAIIAAGLTAVGVLLLIDDWRQEENQAAVASAQRVREELPDPSPTPPPLPTARKTSEGYEFKARDARWDPCGSGPMRLAGDGEKAAA